MSNIREAFERTGNCFVRTVLSSEDAARLRTGAAECFRQLVGSSTPKRGPNTLHFEHAFSGYNEWMRRYIFWCVQTFTRSDVYRLYEELYGPRVIFPLLKCIVRYQRPDHMASHLPYHQDLDASKVGVHMMNCWIALDPSGSDAPGLEAIDAKISELRGELFLSETRDQVGEERWDQHRQYVTSHFANHSITRPVFEPGDGLVFDHFTLHRTYTTESMTKPRMSIEMRAANADDYFDAYGDVAAIVAQRGKNGAVTLSCTKWFPQDMIARETKMERLVRYAHSVRRLVPI
jgi:hypothetical protein